MFRCSKRLLVPLLVLACGLCLLLLQSSVSASPTLPKSRRSLLGDVDEEIVAYAVFPSGEIHGPYTNMYVFLTMPEDEYEQRSFSYRRAWCREHSPKIRILHGESHLNVSLGEQTSEFEDVISCHRDDDDEQGGNGHYSWDHNCEHIAAFRENWVLQVGRAYNHPWSSILFEHHEANEEVPLCGYHATRNASYHCTQVGWSPEAKFNFTNPYNSTIENPRGYATSCTGPYEAKLTFPEWRGQGDGPEMEFQWNLTRNIQISNYQPRIVARLNSETTSKQVSLAVMNRDDFDAVIAMSLTNLPSWLQVNLESCNEYFWCHAEVKHETEMMYMIIKSGFTVALPITFLGENLEYSPDPVIIQTLTERDSIGDFLTRFIMIVEKPVLHLPPEMTLTANNVIEYDIEVRERQIGITTLTFGNNGEGILMWSVEAHSNEWLGNQFNSGSGSSGTVPGCECDIGDVLCGSSDYYESYDLSRCRNNDREYTFYADATALSIDEGDTYQEEFVINTNDDQVGALIIRVNLKILPNLLVLSQNTATLRDVSPLQSSSVLITLFNFYYNKNLIDTFSDDTCAEAAAKTLNSSVIAFVNLDTVAYPWLGASVSNDAILYSESNTINITVVHRPELTPGTHTGAFNLTSVIYEDSTVNVPTTVQIDEITVNLEAVVGKPGANNTYITWMQGSTGSDSASGDQESNASSESSNPGNGSGNGMNSWSGSGMGNGDGSSYGNDDYDDGTYDYDEDDGASNNAGYNSWTTGDASGAFSGVFGPGVSTTAINYNSMSVLSSTWTEYIAMDYRNETVTLIAGEEAELTIHTVDSVNNTRAIPGGVFKAQVNNANGAFFEYNEEFSSADNNDGTHKLKFTLTRSGQYDITMYMKDDATFSWKPLQRAPKSVQVLPKSIDWTNCYVDSDEFHDSIVGFNKTLQLVLRDEFDNNAMFQSFPKQDFNMLDPKLVNQANEAISFNAEMVLDSSAYGRLGLRFNVTSAGMYNLRVNRDTYPIELPTQNRIKYDSTAVSLEHCFFNVSSPVVAGRTGHLTLTLKDGYGNTLKPSEMTSSTAVNDYMSDGHEYTYVAHINGTASGDGEHSGVANGGQMTFVVDEESDSLEVEFNITTSGYSNFSVIAYHTTYQTASFISESPTEVFVTPSDPAYENFLVVQSPCMSWVTAGIGCTSGFIARDSYGNTIVHNDNVGDLKIKRDFFFQPQDSGMGLSSIGGNVEYRGNGNYVVTFTTTQAGYYVRDSLVNGFGSEDIPLPRNLEVRPGQPHDGSHKALADKAVAGDEVSIEILLHDEYGNLINVNTSNPSTPPLRIARPELLNVIGLEFHKDDSPIGFSNPDDISIRENGAIRTVVNLTTAGSLVSRLKVSGEYTSSEFLFQVDSAPVHAPSSHATFKSPLTAGEMLRVSLFAYDRFGNKAEDHGIDKMNQTFVSGNITLTANLVAGGSESPTEMLLADHISYENEQKSVVSLDFNISKSEYYMLDLRFFNVSLDRTYDTQMNSAMLLVQAADINKKMSEICLNNVCLKPAAKVFGSPVTAGDDFELSITARDGFGNRIPLFSADRTESNRYRFTIVLLEPEIHADSEQIQQLRFADDGVCFYTEYDTNSAKYKSTVSTVGEGQRHLHIFHQYYEQEAVMGKVIEVVQWDPFLDRNTDTSKEDLGPEDPDYFSSKEFMVVPRSCSGNAVDIGNGVECVCDSGYFKRGEGCAPCAIGSYKANIGNNTECVQCDSVFTTESTASTSSDQCVCRLGYYKSDTGDRVCSECPAGTMCPEGTSLQTIHLLPGKWRASQNATMILDCPRASCTGGLTKGSIDDSICAEGHTGILCSLCKDGYKASLFEKGSCEVCDKTKSESGYLSWGKWVAFFVALLFFFVLLSFLVKRRKHQSLHIALERHRSKRLGSNQTFMERISSVTTMSPIPLIKIFYNYMVHVSVGTNLKVRMTNLMKKYLQSSDSVASGGIDLGMSVMFEGCASPVPDMNYYDQLTVVLLIPVGLVLFSAFFFLAMLAISLMTGKQFKREGKKSFTHVKGDRMLKAELSYDVKGASERRALVADHFSSWIVSCLILMFMVHSAVASKSFYVFNCFEYEKDKFVIEADFSLTCDQSDSEYKKNYVKGWLGIICYGMGIPVTILLLLVKNRNKLTDRKVLELFGFIYHGFKRDYYWWEVFIMIRKLAILFCVVALSYYPFMQSFCAAGLMVLYLVSHVAASPFEHRILNDLESLSLTCSAFTLQCCMLYSRNKVPGEASWISNFEEYLSIAIVMLNVVFSLLILGCIGGSIVFGLKKAIQAAESEMDKRTGGADKDTLNPLFSHKPQESTEYPAISHLMMPDSKLNGNGHQEEEEAGETSLIMTANPLSSMSN